MQAATVALQAVTVEQQHQWQDFAVQLFKLAGVPT
jgi:hypothetical protein